MNERRTTPCPIEKPAENAGEGANAGIPGARARERRRTLAGIRILVVDDDTDILDGVRAFLEHYGALVTVAGSVAEALAALERSRPDVLLSDIAMPGESGNDLMRRVAALLGGPALPAAALTACMLERDRQQALAAGFQMILGKPIEPEVLIAAVAQLAGRTPTKDPAP